MCTTGFTVGSVDDMCRHCPRMYEVSFVERTQLAHRWRFAGARVGGADAAGRDGDIKTSDKTEESACHGVQSLIA